MGTTNSTWDRQLEDIKSRFASRSDILKHAVLIRANPDLQLIFGKIISSAAQAELNEAYSGGNGDCGAHQYIKSLVGFLDGYSYALGNDAGCYQAIIDQAVKEKDKDYQTYLELKKKFEK